VQQAVESLLDSITNSLVLSADKFVPRVKAGFLKSWWNDTLSELKCMSIDAHNVWKSCTQPCSGETFMQMIEMKQAKVVYKNAIRAHQRDNDLHISNDLYMSV